MSILTSSDVFRVYLQLGLSNFSETVIHRWVIPKKHDSRSICPPWGTPGICQGRRTPFGAQGDEMIKLINQVLESSSLSLSLHLFSLWSRCWWSMCRLLCHNFWQVAPPFIFRLSGSQVCRAAAKFLRFLGQNDTKMCSSGGEFALVQPKFVRLFFLQLHAMHVMHGLKLAKSVI